MLTVFVSRTDAAKIGSNANFNLYLGNTENNLSLKPLGLQWTPDGHISYVTFPNGTRRFFLGADSDSYSLTVSSPITLSQAVFSSPLLTKVSWPNINYPYKNGYSSLGEVLQTDSSNPYHLQGLMQDEQWEVNPDGSLNYNNFTSGIVLSESFDGGQTWTDKTVLIRGDESLPPGTRVTGVGQPSALIINGYVYIYYIDWSAQINVHHPDQIYLAISKINPDGTLNPVQYYTSSGFSAYPVNLKPVIPVPNVPNANYTALPGVSYNSDLGVYIATFETNIGFFEMSSRDGINFVRPKEIFSFPIPQDERNIGTTWYSYPSLLSDSTENSDQTTRLNGNFYYSKGVWSSIDGHNLVDRAFSIR